MKRIARTGIMILLAVSTQANAAYVSERLKLGLYAEPNADGAPVKTLSTGTEVEIVEQGEQFARVRLADGTEGWALKEFLTDSPPAAQQLQRQLEKTKQELEQTTRQRDQLQRQLNAAGTDDKKLRRLQTQLDEARRNNEALQQKLDAAQTENSDLSRLQEEYQKARQTVAQLQQRLNALESQEPKSETVSAGANNPDKVIKRLAWLLVAVLLSAVLGAFLGIRWLAARVRRRFNGLKVW